MDALSEALTSVRMTGAIFYDACGAGWWGRLAAPLPLALRDDGPRP